MINKDYWEFLPVAYSIYEKLYGKPKSHFEWANGFNIRGEIVKVLIENNKKKI